MCTIWIQIGVTCWTIVQTIIAYNDILVMIWNTLTTSFIRLTAFDKICWWIWGIGVVRMNCEWQTTDILPMCKLTSSRGHFNTNALHMMKIAHKCIARQWPMIVDTQSQFNNESNHHVYTLLVPFRLNAITN